MQLLVAPAFTKRVGRLLDRDTYRLLQLRLAANPESGRMIPGTGGLRKLRWKAPGRGKRGGVRVIYYWSPGGDTILLLMLFAKNERTRLTNQQKAALRAIVDAEYR